MNANSRTYPQSAVVHTLARPSVITLTVSLLSVSMFILLQALITASNSKFSNLEVFYHFTSPVGSMIINIIYGIITAAILLVITLGLFLAHRAAVKNNLDSLKKAFDVLLYGLGCAVIFEIIYIVLAFASVYVFNYYADASNHYSNSAFVLFNTTIIIGASVLTLTISLIRVVLSWNRNLTSAEINNKGMIVSTVTAIIGACVFAIMFITALYFLVTPTENSSTQELNVFALITNIFNVLIYTAATVFFIALPIVLGRFNSFVNKYNFAVDNAYTNAGYGNQPHRGYYNYNGTTNIAPNYPPNYSYNTLYQQTLNNINRYGSAAPTAPQAQPTARYTYNANTPYTAQSTEAVQPAVNDTDSAAVEADTTISADNEIKTSYPQQTAHTDAVAADSAEQTESVSESNDNDTVESAADVSDASEN